MCGIRLTLMLRLRRQWMGWKAWWHRVLQSWGLWFSHHWPWHDDAGAREPAVSTLDAEQSYPGIESAYKDDRCKIHSKQP